MTWRDELKVGDRVVVDGGYTGKRIGVVDKVTATQIVVGKSRFVKATGRLIGGGTWCHTSLRECSDKLAEEITRKELVSFVRENTGLLHGFETSELQALVDQMKSGTPAVSPR